jgi:hypothetical protein
MCSDISVEIAPVRYYKGDIPRQGLVDFCVELSNKQSRELLREQEILDKNEKTMSDDQYETLVISQATLMGWIQALRTVTEWARENVEKQKAQEKELSQ